MKRALYITLLGILVLILVEPAYAQVSVGVSVGTPEFGISVGFAPPDIPDYDQPPCPEDGALWTPGYWAWDDDEADYYWVPATWVMPPQPGLLWTPAYWSWDNDAYTFHDGYWAPEVGFYGGINYGFGYYGEGFAGGRWDNDRFMYNTAVLNVNQTVIHNVYVDRSVVVNNTSTTRVSFNGGQGGTNARPTTRDLRVAQTRRIPPAPAQMQNRQAARSNPQLRASTNQGKPAIAATAKPGDFTAHAVAAKSAGGGGWHPPANPREAAKAHSTRPSGNPNPSENTKPGENAGRQNARPEQGTQPQHNPNPAEDVRPGQDRARPDSQPANRPSEAPRQNARPDENSRPQSPQTRPEENRQKQEARPEQRSDERRNAEQKPKGQQKQPDKNPKSKPKEEEHPPQQ